MKKAGWTYSRILQWCIVCCAYGYLLYRLLTFEGYGSFGTYFSQIGWQEGWYLLIAVGLFPLNICFESLKWRSLLETVGANISLSDAQRQTYYGFVGGFFTPSRLGDYPARALLLSHRVPWLSAVALGFVGSLLLTVVIGVFGLPAMIELFVGRGLLIASDTLGSWHYWWAAGAFVFLLLLAGCLPQMSRWLGRRFHFRKVQTQQMLAALGTLTGRRLVVVFGWSVLRYLTFCLQLWLVLLACDTAFQVSPLHSPLLLAIPTYYLLVTLTPTLPAADVAVKGSWAIVIFSAVGGNVASITIATVLMWLINTVAPMLVGSKGGENRFFVV